MLSASCLKKTLLTGQLPSEWKKTTTTHVCPLFKKGDKTEPSNYRPISLTCILCKVMEHIIASNISKHHDKHNALHELQHGFRDLGRQLTLGKQTDLILLDFSKAFHKVNHLKLLHKRACFGIKRNTLKWTQSFLIGQFLACKIVRLSSPT